MVLLNKIKHDNKLFQVIMDDKQNRIILEIKNSNNNYYYMYPDINDLISITKKYYTMSDILTSINNNDKLTNNFIRIAQKVLISGIIISMIMSVPNSVKSFSLEKQQNTYTKITETIPNRVYTFTELDKIFNTQSITKDDVHEAIDANNNLNKYKNIIHEYVDDVDKYNPNQNWWIFYQNINRMNIDYGPEIKTADGTFNPKTSEILILETLKDKELEVVLRHELTHALSLIEIKINDIKVNISFYNNFSGYGRSIMELLTSSFNSYTNDFTDSSYQKYIKLFDPLITEIGQKEFNNTLFNGDINSFINTCNPYFTNIYEYISYVDAIFYNDNGGDVRLKKSIDKDFLTKFSNMSIEFFVNLSYKQLKEGKIKYNEYIDNRTSYMNSLYLLINYNLEKNNITISDVYKYLTKLEQEIFDEEIYNKLNFTLDNREDLIFNISYSNKTQEFKNLIITSLDYNNISKEYYYDLTKNNINDFYFIVEDIDNNLKLRLINENNRNYINIDILNYQYIDYNPNIILKVPLIDYINSKKDIILGADWSNDDYYTTINKNFFNIEDIIEFANNNSYANGITK